MKLTIITQYLENYSDNPEKPHFKNKGEVNFIIELDGMSDFSHLPQADRLKVIHSLVEAKSDDMVRYRYIDYNIQYCTTDVEVPMEELEKITQNFLKKTS